MEIKLSDLTPEEQEEYKELSKDLTCRCGATEDVEVCFNPYDSDVYNMKCLEVLCAECYHDLCMDI